MRTTGVNGVVAGLMASWVKALTEPPLQAAAERILPPSTAQKREVGVDPTGHPENMPPAVLVDRAATNVAINYVTSSEEAAETEAQAHACMDMVRQQGVRDVLVKADVSSEEDVVCMLEEASERLRGVCAFLASDDAVYITGQTIFVDGGLTLYADFREPWSSE